MRTPKKLMNIEDKSEIDKILESCNPEVELDQKQNIISSGFALGKIKRITLLDNKIKRDSPVIASQYKTNQLFQNRKSSIDSVLQQTAQDLQNVRQLYYETVPDKPLKLPESFRPHRTMPKFNRFDRTSKNRTCKFLIC
jgi:hypothetical protein